MISSSGQTPVQIESESTRYQVRSETKPVLGHPLALALSAPRAHSGVGNATGDGAADDVAHTDGEEARTKNGLVGDAVGQTNVEARGIVRTIWGSGRAR